MTESEERVKNEYEQRSQRRLQIPKEQFEAGKVKIARGLKVTDSLKAVRYAPDGRVDLNTVDGLVRALALGVEVHHYREELKRTMTLAEIQRAYFAFLEAPPVAALPSAYMRLAGSMSIISERCGTPCWSAYSARCWRVVLRRAREVHLIKNWMR